VQTQLGADVLERNRRTATRSNSLVARLGFGPVVLLVGYFFALLLHGARYGGDDPARYQAAAELAQGRWPASKYSLIQPIVMAPIYRLASLTGSPQQATMMFFGVFSTTIALLLLANLVRRHRSARFVEIDAVELRAWRECRSVVGPLVVGWPCQWFNGKNEVGETNGLDRGGARDREHTDTGCRLRTLWVVACNSPQAGSLPTVPIRMCAYGCC
jgi:hypothetical protein